MKYYKINDIAKIFDRDPRTIRDWIESGCRTSAGLVRLEALKIGRWWSVSDEALVLFQHRLKNGQSTARPILDGDKRGDK